MWKDEVKQGEKEKKMCEKGYETGRKIHEKGMKKMLKSVPLDENSPFPHRFPISHT